MLPAERSVFLWLLGEGLSSPHSANSWVSRMGVSAWGLKSVSSIYLSQSLSDTKQMKHGEGEASYITNVNGIDFRGKGRVRKSPAI